jgi:GMP synthase (glutamine-hydrolysing)
VAPRGLAILVTGEPVPSALRARGDFVELIRNGVGDAWSGPWHVVDLRRGDPLPTADELAGVIVTGSAAFLEEGAEWMQKGVAHLASLITASVPIFGICFGHQMLGQALGGRVGRNPLGREIGTVPLQLCLKHRRSDDSVLPERVYVHTTHLDSVLELPPGAKVLASTELEPNAFVQFAERAWGVQFHPEMDARVMRCYLEDRRAALSAEGREPELLLSQVADTPESAKLLRSFALGCAGEHAFDTWTD